MRVESQEAVHQARSNAQFQQTQFVTGAQNFYRMSSYSLLFFRSKLAYDTPIFHKAVVQEMGKIPHLLNIFSDSIRRMEPEVLRTGLPTLHRETRLIKQKGLLGLRYLSYIVYFKPEHFSERCNS